MNILIFIDHGIRLKKMKLYQQNNIKDDILYNMIFNFFK